MADRIMRGLGTDPAPPRDRLIVALDVPSAEEARELVRVLGSSVTFYKVGLELLFAGGLDLAHALKADGKRVFLDLKLLDIAATVERAVANASRIGIDFLTIHGHDTATVAAAVAGRGDGAMKLLAVTVLTSLSPRDLIEQGTTLAPAELVLRRARLAEAAGCDGVVASGLEAGAIRAATVPGFLIVTPGIRFPEDATSGQARATAPSAALAAGADYLVVGRPITRARDPKAAAQRFLDEIDTANTAGAP